MLPNDRLNLCYDYMRRLGLFNNQNLLRFGFELGTTFMEVPCKILSGVQVNGYSPRDNVSHLCLSVLHFSLSGKS